MIKNNDKRYRDLLGYAISSQKIDKEKTTLKTV